jgi:Cd2+/Zn2+-exporting ATPase
LAVVRHALEKGVQFEAPEEFQARPGQGTWARLEGATLEVGRPELFADLLEPATRQQIEVFRNQGKTVVVVVREAEVVGLVVFADAPRSEAAAALEELRSLGQRLVLVTGDHPHAAASLASRLGIQEVHAGLMPEGKLALLQRFEAEGLPVVMVGDGINDTPALAAATVGVSLGAAGSAVALETADISLMGDDLRGLPAALRLARRARSVVLENIVFALGLKAVFLGLALTGNAGMWMAIAADTGASLLVTLNGLRLVGAGKRAGAELVHEHDHESESAHEAEEHRGCSCGGH